MTAGLEVPATHGRELRAAMDDDERLAVANRLLRERTDDPPGGEYAGR
jgi:hypothetical protein